MIHQWFPQYQRERSPTEWFLSKIAAEITVWRLATQSRGQVQHPEAFEAYALRLVKERIESDREHAREGWQLASSNLMMFEMWVRHSSPEALIRCLGQRDPLRFEQTTEALQREVIERDGHALFWSFHG